ncbi:MAG: threonylcarbamoyl-AMP synthase [Verrucomicrobiales bacterium]|nr:threonylcarbamoyl-AMP synthase [Verrucomicrobiales bacterium]
MDTFIAPTDRADLLRTAVNQAVDFLRDGEVVALPAETVYGLAADAMNPAAVARIFEAKERPSFDPLIVHLPHRKRLADVAVVPAEIAETVNLLIEKFWPGPLTLVLPKHESVPEAVTGGLPTVAVRMSSHPVFKAVVTSFGGPLAAPSANRFGRISPTSAGAVMKELEGRIPLILDGGACPEGLESTIIRIIPSEKGKPVFRILRAGPVTKDDLQPYGKIEWGNGQPDKKGQVAPPEVPGQLPSHYAPRTPLRLVENPDHFLPEEGKRYALLSYRGDAEDGYLDLTEWEHVLVLSPGSGKLPEAALRLFHCLRALDELEVDEIIAEPVPLREVGMAIMERLRRASYL